MSTEVATRPQRKKEVSIYLTDLDDMMFWQEESLPEGFVLNYFGDIGHQPYKSVVATSDQEFTAAMRHCAIAAQAVARMLHAHRGDPEEQAELEKKCRLAALFSRQFEELALSGFEELADSDASVKQALADAL